MDLGTRPGVGAARRFAAEFVGTFALVFFAVGSAVFGIDVIGRLGVALAFGFVMLTMAYAIGPVSGAHINPAVTLGSFLRGGISLAEAAVYWVVQVAGAVAAAALIKLLTTDFGKVQDQTGDLGSNNWGKHITMGGDFVLEIVLTAGFVLVVLLVTAKAAAPDFAGLAIGFALALVHLDGLPLDGTSVNPARSLGPALLNGGEPLSHVWLYIVAPLIGGIVAAVIAPILLPRSVDREGEPVAKPMEGPIRE